MDVSSLKIPSLMPMSMARRLHDLGYMMILDDKDDVGWFSYSHRPYHTYRGKPSPKHPSPVHHWQLGGLLMIIAELAGVLEMAKELQTEWNATDEAETPLPDSQLLAPVQSLLAY